MEFALTAISVALWGIFLIEILNLALVFIGVFSSNDDDNLR